MSTWDAIAKYVVDTDLTSILVARGSEAPFVKTVESVPKVNLSKRF